LHAFFSLNLYAHVFRMDLGMMQAPSSTNYSDRVLNFLHRQHGICAPAIVQVITGQTDLRNLIRETRINRESL